jgi:uncharacterized protein (DUF4415 family)
VFRYGKGGGLVKIDFSDIPELSDEQLASMRRVGRPPLGRAARTPISIRVDSEVLSRPKATAAKRGVPYQSLINDILARAMAAPADAPPDPVFATRRG